MSNQPKKCRFLCGFLNKIYQIPCRIICILVLVAQSYFLNNFLVLYNNPLWWLFSILDLAVVIIFIVAFVISYRKLKSDDPLTVDQVEQTIGGELPLGYIAWLVYSLTVAAKIGLIFGTSLYIAQKITEATFFGPNLLRTTLSLSSVVFFLLIMTHHNAPDKSERQAFIDRVTASVTIDILDAIQFLDVLYLAQSHIILEFSLHQSIVVISCLNMLLPTILLFALSRSSYGRSAVWLKRLRVIHRVIYFIAVNVPMLVIRLVVWHVHRKDVSVFLIKNVISVGVVVNEVYMGLIELNRPMSMVDQQIELTNLEPAKPVVECETTPVQHADSSLLHVKLVTKDTS